MKTQSRALKITVVLTIGLISIIAFHAFAKKPDTLSGAPIKRQWAQAKRLKNPDPAAFKKLLDANEAIYCVTVRKDAADQGTQLDNGGRWSAQHARDAESRAGEALACCGADVSPNARFCPPWRAGRRRSYLLCSRRRASP